MSMKELHKKILELKKNGLSINKIVSETGISRGVVSYVFSSKFSKRQKKAEAREKAEEEFVELVKKYLPISNSINNLCTKLGLKGVDGYYRKINKIIEKYKLSTEHFGTIKIERYSRSAFTAMSDEEFFVKDSHRNGSSLIKRLVDSCYKEYKCENPNCGISEWDGKSLRLQIHHINGDHYDNRIENLQLLCPNCHSQTDTYGRRNLIEKNSFKINERINEILNETESKFKPSDIEGIKLKVLEPKSKKYCRVCGKEITGYGVKYCSHECSQKASRKCEAGPEQLIEDFKILKSFRAVGRKYNVTDNAIKHKTQKLGIYDTITQYITHK